MKYNWFKNVLEYLSMNNIEYPPLNNKLLWNNKLIMKVNPVGTNWTISESQSMPNLPNLYAIGKKLYV